jgi:hypothetical protein
MSNPGGGLLKKIFSLFGGKKKETQQQSINPVDTPSYRKQQHPNRMMLLLFISGINYHRLMYNC